MEIEKLPGLPDDQNTIDSLNRLHLRMESLGVNVIEDSSSPNHARFVGIFDSHTITLYPKVAPAFALWFTIAHLYGHMVQLLNETPRVQRANSLVLRLGETLSAEDVQLIYDHEREAAEIGRRLIAETEHDIPLEMDQAYCRFFHADFRYLINVIETKESGTAVFSRFWKREPIPRELIIADSRPLVDLREATALSDDEIIVV